MIKNYATHRFENLNNTKIKKSVEDFHQQRTAFIIWDNNVKYLKNSKLSHLQWAKELEIDETQFNSLTRGYVLNNNIVFYKGNFEYDEQVITDANTFAPQILKECLLEKAKVYVGLVIGEIGTIYQPDKYLFDL